MAGPRSIGIHQTGIGSGKNIVVRGNRTPYLRFCKTAINIIAIVELGQHSPSNLPFPGKNGPSAGVGLVLTGPNRFVQCAGRIRSRVFSIDDRVVHTHNVDCRLQRGVVANCIYDAPLAETFSGILIAADELGRNVPLTQYTMQFLHIGRIKLLLVPNTCICNGQTVLLVRTFKEIRDVARHIV